PPTSPSAVMSIAASPASYRLISHPSFLPRAGLARQNSHFIRLGISKDIIPGRGQYRRFPPPSSPRQTPPHQALYKGEQQHNHGQSHDRPGDRPREKYAPIVREADHRVHEGFFGDWSEDRAKYQRGDRKLQPLEAVAEDAEADDQPQIGDVVADRQGTDEAEDKHIGGYD